MNAAQKRIDLRGKSVERSTAAHYLKTSLVGLMKIVQEGKLAEYRNAKNHRIYLIAELEGLYEQIHGRKKVLTRKRYKCTGGAIGYYKAEQAFLRGESIKSEFVPTKSPKKKRAVKVEPITRKSEPGFEHVRAIVKAYKNSTLQKKVEAITAEYIKEWEIVSQLHIPGSLFRRSLFILDFRKAIKGNNNGKD